MGEGIWLAVIGIAATPFSAALGALLMRRKYKVEIDGLKVDIEKKLSEVTGIELDNVRQGNDILMKQIVEPLKTEVKTLRADVNKFRKAIEKIPVCPHSVECPVSIELHDIEKKSDDKTGWQY